MLLLDLLTFKTIIVIVINLSVLGRILLRIRVKRSDLRHAFSLPYPK
jgi:hypothetical protein